MYRRKEERVLPESDLECAINEGLGTFISAPDMTYDMHDHTTAQIESMINSPIVKNLEKSIVVIGGYSHDTEGEVAFDNSSLRLLRKKFLPTEEDDFHLRVDLDLKFNQKETDPYTGTDRKYFLNMLKWINYHYNGQEYYEEEEVSDSDDECSYAISSSATGQIINDKFDADFVCVRNALTMILTTPFQFGKEYIIYATRYKGKIYLMKERSEKEDIVATTARSLDLADWGHKFADFLTKGIYPRDGTTVNDHYRAVIQANIGKHKILYSSKLCVADETLYKEDDDNLKAFINIKCVIQPRTEWAMLNYIRNKMLLQYTDMLLSGTPKCITGYRNKDAIVENLKLMTKDELIHVAGGQWNPTVCLDFVEMFLTTLKGKFTEDGEVWKIEKPSNSTNISFMKLEGNNRDNFLPDWYKDKLDD